ncbi:uncharacterized protein LOC127247900 [Andrographis paniculata]|uniref:uncharacterized protein LOC127247900 n=1 Tax=Andrographis paniculata TaxID=175694 RepID=UPI0021E7C6BE|nr:uncharacterized protein LOC127247900 [Andrographis paniculata]XP_051125943.1 uncharacterized protein LOC127247900 [Andrographis paniculata]
MDFLEAFFIVVLLAAGSPATATLGGFSGGREDLVKWAGYGDEKLSTVVIGGKLLCHGNAAATALHPYPISGATVAVMCGTKAKAKKLWLGRARTDRHGEFAMDIPSHLHAIPNLEKICRVKVVSLPWRSACRHACTRKLRRIELAATREGIRTYTAHDIHLMPRKLT